MGSRRRVDARVSNETRAQGRRSSVLPPSPEPRAHARIYDAKMSSPFTPKTLSFLRALKRKNDWDWFRARKDKYERTSGGPWSR